MPHAPLNLNGTWNPAVNVPSLWAQRNPSDRLCSTAGFTKPLRSRFAKKFAQGSTLQPPLPPLFGFPLGAGLLSLRLSCLLRQFPGTPCSALRIALLLRPSLPPR